MVVMVEAYKTYWMRFADFSGRSTRGQYWWPALVNFLITVVLYVPLFATLSTVQSSAPGGETTVTGGVTGVSAVILGTIFVFMLANVIPGLSVTVRRLHDVGRSGWWWWIQLVPVVGPFVLLVFMVLPSDYSSPYPD